jgi:predicted phage terminase large subunit-like protein
MNDSKLPGDHFTAEEIDKLIHDPVARADLAKRSHYWFSHLYLGKFADYPTAWFHKEMFKITEDPTIRWVDICGFRGCAKSTIFTYSYPIWAIVGCQQKKLIVIVSKTRDRSRNFLADIKRAFESCDLLRADLGPFQSVEDQWGAYALVIPKYGAKIVAMSTDQSLRSQTFDGHRPDIVIMDDLESQESVKTREGREKLLKWIDGDVVPAGDSFTTRYFLIGSLLHEDGVIMTFKKLIEEGSVDGVFKAYPFFDQFGVPLWKEKFKSTADVERLRKTIPSESAWQREFLLHLVPDKNQIIKPEWIQNHHGLPDIRDSENHFRYAVIVADLAISMSSKADKTAVVIAYVYGWGKDLKIYLYPNPINQRMEFPDQVAKLKTLSDTLIPGQRSQIVVEQVGYQSALIQQLISEGYPVKGMPVYNQDKAARLALASVHIMNGTVLFAKRGNEELKQQLIGFGVEKFDDLCDACSMLINYVMGGENQKPVIGIMFYSDGEWTECFV